MYTIPREAYKIRNSLTLTLQQQAYQDGDMQIYELTKTLKFRSKHLFQEHLEV
jgi:hypothetical protein